MKTREVVFYSEGDKMAGTVYLPDDYKDGEKRPCIIANSGWTGLNMVYPALFSRAMTAKGYVCMGFCLLYTSYCYAFIDYGDRMTLQESGNRRQTGDIPRR